MFTLKNKMGLLDSSVYIDVRFDGRLGGSKGTRRSWKRSRCNNEQNKWQDVMDLIAN